MAAAAPCPRMARYVSFLAAHTASAPLASCLPGKTVDLRSAATTCSNYPLQVPLDHFSSTCYYYGEALAQGLAAKDAGSPAAKAAVPIGLIHTAWGGSMIEQVRLCPCRAASPPCPRANTHTHTHTPDPPTPSRRGIGLARARARAAQGSAASAPSHPWQPPCPTNHRLTMRHL